MEAVLLALLFGAALWMADLYNANKFRHFYPKLTKDLLPKGAPRWKKVWVYRNQALKYVGLTVIWAGITLGSYFPGSGDIAEVNPFYAVGFLGLALYIGSRLWPTLVEMPRPRRKS